jgi:Domain of unknown function (DUF397)
MGEWRKSSYSSANGGDCVAAASGNGLVKVHDTANRGDITLGFPAGAWQRFTTSLR